MSSKEPGKDKKGIKNSLKAIKKAIVGPPRTKKPKDTKKKTKKELQAAKDSTMQANRADRKKALKELGGY
jgi:hypothetical protein